MALQTMENSPKTLLGFDAAEDEMRMLVAWRDKSTCNFDARMASLNCLLRVRQIAAYESVDIRNVRFACPYLRETSVAHSLSFLYGLVMDNRLATISIINHQLNRQFGSRTWGSSSRATPVPAPRSLGFHPER